MVAGVGERAFMLPRWGVDFLLANSKGVLPDLGFMFEHQHAPSRIVGADFKGTVDFFDVVLRGVLGVWY